MIFTRRKSYKSLYNENIKIISVILQGILRFSQISNLISTLKKRNLISKN